MRKIIQCVEFVINNYGAIFYVVTGIIYPIFLFYCMTSFVPFSVVLLYTIFFWPVIVALFIFMPRKYVRSYVGYLRLCIVIDTILTVIAYGSQIISARFDYDVLPAWLATCLFYRFPTDLVTLLFIPSRKLTDSALGASLAAIRFSTATILLCSLGVGIIVIIQAEDVARGRPYCLQVADPRELGAYGAYDAPGFLDLSAWKMRAYPQYSGGSDEFVVQRHAIVAVEEGDGYHILNWSYRSLNFRDDTNGSMLSRHIGRQDLARLLPNCVPQVHYGRNLLISSENAGVARSGL